MNLNSLYPNQRYVVLDTVQAAGADIAVANSVISVGNPLVPICLFKDISTAQIQASVAEVLQVTTLTPVAAANSEYAFTIQQYSPRLGTLITKTYTYTSLAAGDTATTIGDKFRAMINADPTIFVAATGAATLILTAEAGYAKFTVTITSVGGGLTQATGTAGVVGVNTTASLATQGITVTNASYTSITINFSPTTGYSNQDSVNTRNQFVLYINQGDADYTDLVTKATQILGNLVVGGVTASIENAAIL